MYLTWDPNVKPCHPKPSRRNRYTLKRRLARALGHLLKVTGWFSTLASLYTLVQGHLR